MSQDVLEVPAVPLRDYVLFPSVIAPLYVARKRSVHAVAKAIEHSGYVLCITQRDPATEEPKAEDLYEIGTLCKVPQMIKLQDGSYKVLIEGVKRARLKSWSLQGESFLAGVHEIEQTEEPSTYHQSLTKILQERFASYAKQVKNQSAEMLEVFQKVHNPGSLCDLIASSLPISAKSKQEILQTLPIQARLEQTVVFLQQEMDWTKVEQRLNARIKDRITEEQDRYYKNQKLRAIQQELQENNGEEDPSVAEYDEFYKKIKKLKLAKDSEEKVLSELKKFKLMPAISSEATVVRMYLEWVVALPWNTRSKALLDIAMVKTSLDKAHFGLEKVKSRILQSLAVQKRKKKVTGPIMCLLGPPGVGKTSLGKSVAEAIGRPFVRISLGGVRDESEIRGHRKTYIGSMPGRIIKALKRAKVKNPLVLLDEIDKMGMDYRGDPASALLEVLDPEQNKTFSDHYLELDFDLSEVMFMTTANTMDIPPALKDRMEIIHLAGYTETEKFMIAKRHLLPQALSTNGVKSNELLLTDTALRTIIRQYTREAGVRALNRVITELLRKFVLAKLEKPKKYEKTLQVIPKSLPKWLGVALSSEQEIHSRVNRVGVINGLAWTSVGGQLLVIEALVYPGKGQLSYTGSLGEVMQESIKAALSLIRSQSETYAFTPEVFSKQDCHVHVPEGATPKDGPSAGIGMCCALLSAFTKKPIRHDVALTGEVTLVGDVLAIGGLKEKLLAALRNQIKEVIIPEANRKDMQDMPSEVKKGLKIHFVRKVTEVFPRVLAE